MTPLFAKAEAPRGFVKASGTLTVDGEGRNFELRGLNLGGWLLWESYILRFGGPETTESRMKRAIVEAVGKDDAYRFFRELRNSQLSPADVRRIRKLGFNCVRVPFNANILNPEGHFDLSAGDGWRLLDNAVDWCEKEGIYVILDMHSAPGGQNAGGISDTELKAGLWVGPAKHDFWRQTSELWREIASRYRNRTIVAAYNLMNEPVVPKGVEKKELTELSKMIIAAIREVDREHMIMVEGNWYSTDFSMFGGENLDSNLCYQFHKYWNETTHASIGKFLDLRRDQNAPIWLGEFGENNHKWYARCVELVEEHGIGWCFWPYKRTQGGCVEAASVPKTWARAARALRGEDPPGALSRGEILTGLRDLAKAFKLSNCTEDKATVKALLGGFEQSFKVPGSVPAADYNRCSISHKGNEGGALRAGDADVYENGKGGYIVRNLEAGDTLEYSVELRAKDVINTAAADSSGKLEITIDGKPASAEGMKVGAGKHAVVVKSLENGASLGSIIFSASPGRIDAESFLPGEGVGYHDADEKNKGEGGDTGEGVDVKTTGENEKAVAWIEDGEWLTYKVTAERGGKFGILLSASAPKEGGVLNISLDGEVVAENLQVPATGGWDNWKDLSAGTVRLSPGEHVLRVDALKGGFDLDYFLFVPR